MNHNLRKTAGYLSIIALLNGSCAPLYAQKGGLETDDQAPRHPIQQQRKTVTWEEWGQQRATSLADRIASWIPQGVKSYLITLGEETTSLVNGKTPMEVDYSDPAIWQALFETELEAVKKNPTSDGLKALKEFRGVVFDGLLSPRIYEEAFQDLQRLLHRFLEREAHQTQHP